MSYIFKIFFEEYVFASIMNKIRFKANKQGKAGTLACARQCTRTQEHTHTVSLRVFHMDRLDNLSSCESDFQLNYTVAVGTGAAHHYCC
jgi:hypothetical protein